MTQKDLIPCDDCKKPTPWNLIDAWIKPGPNVENAPQADAHLCKTCHEHRGPSGWGPWCPA